MKQSRDTHAQVRASALSGARAALRADCARCIGLCCIAPPFTASSDFAFDKRGGEPCRHLHEARCTIHEQLRARGFRGCTVYDCFGAGQALSAMFDGANERERMYAQLPLHKQLREMEWYLHEALARVNDGALHGELCRLRERCEQHARDPALQEGELFDLRARVAQRLGEASEEVRAGVADKQRDRARADLVGKKLRAIDLRGASLRGALLIATDLRDANLTSCDLLGADLRDADLRGADLTGALFLTQPQLEAARGDAKTKLPAWLDRPGHWSARTGRALPRL